MNYKQTLSLKDYLRSTGAWEGLLLYVREHVNENLDEKGVSKHLIAAAKEALIDPDTGDDKDFQTFRKAISNLKNKKILKIKKDNIFRLLFVLGLTSDLEAHRFLMDYLHHNELSVRCMDEFIVLAALKLQLSWKQTKELLYERYAELIKNQPNAPSDTEEGFTAEVYQRSIDQFSSVEDLTNFLDDPREQSFFAKSANTRYLAMFYEVEPKSERAPEEKEAHVRLEDLEGENVSLKAFRMSLFGLSDYESTDRLSLEEIDQLSRIFEDVFLDETAFEALIHRRRLGGVSSGTFLLSYFQRMDPSDDEFEYYIDFHDPEDFRQALDEWLTYYGFPSMNPETSAFDRLLLDVYQEIQEQADPYAENEEIYSAYIQSLRSYLRQLIQLTETSEEA